jgi:hypothetical protein
MRTNFQGFRLLLNSGVSTISEVLSIPVNGNLYLLPNEKNSLIKSIDLCILSEQESSVIDFYDIRFQGLNRDGSIITQNAGIIQNPISGAWGSAFIKDSNLDFVLSSKKSQIVFKDGILLGGIRPLSYSLKFKNPITLNTVIRLLIYINYE